MPREKPTQSLRHGARPRTKRGNRSALRLLLGLLLCIVAALGVFWLYHRMQLSRKPPTEPARPAPTRKPRPTPQTEAIGHTATTDPETAPFGISEDVFEAGARLYASRCASCHGAPHHVAAAHSTALQLWQPNHSAGGTGVSHQRPVQIYRSIAQGAPAAGMPAYRGVLTSAQLWRLSLLLNNAGQDLPDPVLHLLNTAQP